MCGLVAVALYSAAGVPDAGSSPLLHRDYLPFRSVQTWETPFQPQLRHSSVGWHRIWALPFPEEKAQELSFIFS